MAAVFFTRENAGMDDLPLYYDPSDTMYHILEDNDSGVGADDLPFTAYSGTLYESENPTSPSNQSYQTVFVNTIGNRGNGSCRDNDDGDDEGENDLEYVDDDQDYDYRPNKNVISKKGKGKLKKHRHLKTTIDMTRMFTPPKKTEPKLDEMTGTRHYAHKDRTPRTILKMMEKHRESERVRHHSLNESMKTICSRVPGYDPHSKETKVIQMQRIIGYECFLENTINNLCEQLGVRKKLLGINTNFITEAMKDKKPEDWFKLGPIEVPMTEEEEDSLLEATSTDSLHKFVRKPTSAPMYYTNFKREKISSPTVDSTTDNIIQLFPGRASATSQRSESSLEGSMSSHGFRPIQESQELGIKTETQTTVGDTVFHDTIDSLFEQELCSEPENLKTVTATFMNDEVTTSIEETATEFNLSSPVRYTSNKVFLQSPKPSGVWHQPLSLYHVDSSEHLGSTEMTSISPEYILETKPKDALLELNEITVGEIPDIEEYYNSEHERIPATSPIFSSENYFTEEPFKPIALQNDNPLTPSNFTGSKNKRKRYTPVRAPFKNISNTLNDAETYYDGNNCVRKCARIAEPAQHVNVSNSNEEELYTNDRTLSKNFGTGASNGENDDLGSESSEKCTKKVVKIFRHLGCSIVKDGVRPPFIVISTQKENSNSTENHTISLGNSLQNDILIPASEMQLDGGSIITAPFSKVPRNRPATLTETSFHPDDQSILIGQPLVQNQRRAEPGLSQAPMIGQRNIRTNHSTNEQPRVVHRSVTPQEGTAENIPLIDHRKTTWMNGFMMYSRLNRSKFLSTYPGLQSSQLQRVMAETWRNMSSQEQRPYREKARKFSDNRKKAESQDSGYHGSDRLVPSSTTDDLECIIAGL